MIAASCRQDPREEWWHAARSSTTCAEDLALILICSSFRARHGPVRVSWKKLYAGPGSDFTRALARGFDAAGRERGRRTGRSFRAPVARRRRTLERVARARR